MITSFFFGHAQGRNLRRHEKFGPASSKRLQAPYGAGWLSSSPRRGERNWFEVNDVVVFEDSSIRTVFKRNEPLVRQQDSLHEIFRFDREARGEPRSHRCGRCSDLRERSSSWAPCRMAETTIEKLLCSCALRGQFAHACGESHCYPKFQALVGLLGGG